MPQYLFLLYGDESRWAAPTDEEIAAEMARHGAFAEAVAAAGAQILGGSALRSTQTASTLRRDAVDAEPLLTDGPFAETKEALGGYYLVEARDLDQALELARVCPVGRGGVEVRPIWQFGS
ncbi:YciI family protein [Geodermatophilus sp. SYSU D00691]